MKLTHTISCWAGILNGDALDEDTPGSLAGNLHCNDWLDGGDGNDRLAGNGGSDDILVGERDCRRRVGAGGTAGDCMGRMSI